MAYDLVILDCDGVLVDSEPVSNALLAEHLTEVGLPMSTEESMRDFMGRPWAAGVEIIEERLGRPLPDDFADRYHDALYEAFARDLEAVAGIAAALDAIELPLCVASSGTHDRIRIALRSAGLLERFPDETIFSAADVARGKPAPDLFLYAAERMGFEPSRCVVVEDAPAGVQAGRAAGMDVLGYAGLTPEEQLAAEGARTFASMAELPALINGSAPRSA
jgi:HAD superfamily hydrolase (TIGR01509 family)